MIDSTFLPSWFKTMIETHSLKPLNNKIIYKNMCVHVCVNTSVCGSTFCCLCSYSLWLQVAFLLQDFTVSDLGFDEVLLGGRQEEALRIHRSNNIIPNGTALTVITTHPSWQVLLYHLQTAVVLTVRWLVSLVACRNICQKENSEDISLTTWP